MNGAKQPTACGFGAMAPTATDLINFCESGRIKRPEAALSLRGGQAHFLPVSRAFARLFTRIYRANHGAVEFGDHMICARWRQSAVVLSIVFLQQLSRLVRRFKRALTHRIGADFKPVMFLHFACGLGKGVIGSKVAENPLQETRNTPRTHADSSGKGTLITVALGPPNSFLHTDQPEDTSPSQPFFLP